MLDKIIESTKYVENNSKYIKINKNKLEEFAESMRDISKVEHWLSSSPYCLLELPVETIVNFLLIYESINFSFWGTPKWTVNTGNKEEDGSMALLYVLLKYVKENNNTDFSKVSKEEFKELLKGNVQIPLLEKRYEIISNVSKIVNEKMGGNFYYFIKDIYTDIELFNTILKYFPSFKDEREYRGQTIYLYKLGQLLTSDILHIREKKENIKVDYSNLIGCADYKIPQVLRGIGILEYSEKLAQLVNMKKEIEEGSEYEVEIRASVLIVIDEIKKFLDNKYYSIDINDYIYGQSRNKEFNLKPYHLTRTTSY